jgi:tetratricopeptide (TPR) repeat protein
MKVFDEKKYIERLKDLSARLSGIESNVDILLSDLDLQKQDIAVFWVLDFSELYRYIHPTLDYAQFTDERLYFSEQFAIRSLIDYMPGPKILLSSYWREYKGYLNRVRLGMMETLADFVLQGSLEILKKDDTLQELYSELSKSESSTAYPTISRAISGVKLLFWDLLRTGAVKDAFEQGVDVFQNLLEGGKLKTLEDLSIKLEVETHRPDSLYREFLSKLDRRRPYRHTSNAADAEAMAILVDLNRSMWKQNSVFILVSNTELLHKLFPIFEIDVGDRKDLLAQLPAVRDLYYFLLRSYFCSPNYAKSKEDVLVSIQKVTEFRDMIKTFNETVKPIRAEEDLKRLLDSERFMQDFEEVCSSLESQLDEIAKLPFSRGHYEFLGKKIQDLVKLKGSEKIDPTLLRERLNSVARNPVDIFEDLKDAIASVSRSITKLEGIVAKLFPRKPSHVDIGYFYDEKRLTDADRRIEPNLQEIFSLIGSANPEDENRALDLINELRPTNPSSVALIVAFAIILRRKGIFEKALEELRRAEEIESNHPEVFFQRAILSRKIAEEMHDEKAFKEATEFCEKALILQPSEPRYLRELAYIYWSKAEKTCIDAEHMIIKSEEYFRLVSEAIKFGQRAKELLDKPRTTRQKELLASVHNDLAYYLALGPDRQAIEEAHNLIKQAYKMLGELGQHIPDAFEDTLGFVSLRKFLLKPSKNNANLLKTAIACFLSALRKTPSNKFAAEHLAQASVEAMKLLDSDA